MNPTYCPAPAPAPATPCLDLRDIDIKHEMLWRSCCDPGGEDPARSFFISGLVERAVTDDDIKPAYDALGRPARWLDGGAKLLMVVPLVIFQTDFTAGSPGCVRVSWLVHGTDRDKLADAMKRAGAPGRPPEAAAFVVMACFGDGGYQIDYRPPTPESRQELAAQLARLDMTPIERQFWEAHLRLGLPELAGLVPQYQVGSYRTDFALPARKIVFELDGFATHSSTADIARDRQRQRDLQALGLTVIRFGGAEVHRDAEACVRQAAQLARALVMT
jgi:very-short-patch-repair endonuclease